MARTFLPWRRDNGVDPAPRTLTASATRLKLTDRQQARQTRVLRQGWQADAWTYRDSIGELRYAVSFLANCAARMRIYPAAYPTGEGVETDTPVPLSDANMDQSVVSAAAAAMQGLGNGKLAISQLLESLSTNISIAGECFLLGRQDELTGRDVWTIRSVDEIVVAEDQYKLRELPMSVGSGSDRASWISLDPETTLVSRIWTPHPRFQLLADSPLRAIIDDCESLLILRRMIRATGRSRLAGRGLLLIPDELSIKVPNDDNADPESDPFLGQLAEAMLEPIADEGVASAVVPIVVRGPGEMLAKVQHIDMASKFDDQSSKVREEMVGVIATGLDIPKEILVGMSDLNHWTAWQVDDSTFRHHVEPHVIKCCDALSGAYLRPYLEAAGIAPDVAARVLLWYDPTELVTHPDQTEDALQLHDRLVISDSALLRVSGFGDEDAPSKQEIQVRLLEKMRTWPPNLVMEFLHQWDPTLVVPPITESGTVPGIKSGGVDTGPAPDPTQNQGPAPPPPAAQGPPSADPAGVGPPPPEAVTASGAVRSRLSAKLVNIDRDLRSKLQTAACAAMMRQLERAGAKLRTKVAKDETSRTKIAQRPNELVASLLGPQVVTAVGLSAGQLMHSDWSSLRKQFMEWTEAAQLNAIKNARQIAHLEEEDDAVTAAQEAMAAGREGAWATLETALNGLGQQLLFAPHPDTAGLELEAINQDTLVPTGLIRAALAVAGGYADPPVEGAIVSSIVGQIGTGTTIQELITAGGGERQGFEWVHGPATNPFEPHEALDGVEFENFDADVLANNGDFPDNEYFMPGDHDGCTCDFMPLWVSPSG